MSVFLLAGLLTAGCSSPKGDASSGSPEAGEIPLALCFSELPVCTRLNDGQVWYVWSDGQFYVCDGAHWKVTNVNGLNAATRVIPIDAGTTCAAGGMTIQFGLDRNRNNRLDVDEVSSATNLCQGAKGATGAQGPTGMAGTPGPEGSAGKNALISLTAEPAGVHCAGGGVAVKTGLDANGNGELDPSEVKTSETSYICNGGTALTKASPEVAGAHCPHGGTAVATGLDVNGNGALEASEITSTSYVCNGADGLNTIAAVVVEPAGSHCAQGGQAIRMGLDRNSDGVLQPTEIAQTAYLCNGARGAAGEKGKNSLVRQVDEAVGAHCTFGGSAILSGLDNNDNGYLDVAEITTTSYACNGAPGSPGHATLFTSTAEGTGANCAAGGTRIESWFDSNDNGLHDSGELSQVRYICNGLAGANGHNSLVESNPEPMGPHCTDGGVRIDSGVDGDDNGVLGTAEIAATNYACNAAAGSNGLSLVATSHEPAGIHCTSGGTQLQIGQDSNSNGVLDPGEVTSTSYVCNPGSVELRVSNAAWGGACARGGVKVETGIDQNGNGVLDDAEVQRTHYACNRYLVQVSAGLVHTCGVVSDGTAVCWGRNESGQLGDGTTSDRSIPVAVSGLASVAELAAGWSHTCARLADGTVRCWGWNAYGELGDGTTSDRSIPVAVSGLTSVAEVVAGSFHTCARLTDGSARCWGANYDGTLGDGTTTIFRSTPVAVSGLTSVAELAAGNSHTCARLSDGSAYCWGWNHYGQIGDGTTTLRSTPVAVSGLTSVAALAAGYYHTCVRLTDGSARCWGWNAYSQLGDGTTADQSIPVAVSGLGSVDELATGYFHTCARLTDGSARCWGSNNDGQLGDGTTMDRSFPVAVSGLTSIAELVAGDVHTCALLTDGTARCWGTNDFGQLGDGTTTDRLVPAPVVWSQAP